MKVLRAQNVAILWKNAATESPGNGLSPTEYGWSVNDNVLQPIWSQGPSVPDTLFSNSTAIEVHNDKSIITGNGAECDLEALSLDELSDSDDRPWSEDSDSGQEKNIDHNLLQVKKGFYKRLTVIIANFVEKHNHEEADTLIPLHCLNAASSKPGCSIDVFTVDTDVISSPVGHGWEDKDTSIMPIMCLKSPAPQALLELIKCGCKGKCDKRQYSCLRNNLHCTPACLCGDCHNQDDAEKSADDGIGDESSSDETGDEEF
ncbi:hypothetical protein GQR58_006938 [Nymphon striatum]|nr:hypothetical protein GQR58_006938 [Nymphon striatum]